MIGRASETNQPIPMSVDEFDDFAGSMTTIRSKFPRGALPQVEWEG